MSQLTNKETGEFLAAAHRIAKAGLLRYSSGNLSWRLNENVVAISGTRSWLGELREDQIALYHLGEDRCLNQVKQSVESDIHFSALRGRPDVNVVLHFQSPAATAFCCGEITDVDFNVIPEVPYYIGIPAWVEYHTPGSSELANAVTEKILDHDMVLLRGHGLVTVGKNFEDATQKAGFFELACQIMLSGHKTQRLPDAGIQQLLTGEISEG